MNLKEQTVYIPTKNFTEWFLSNDAGEDGFLEEKQNQILLSKDELVELIRDAYSAGSFMEFHKTNETDDDYINNLFNQ